MMPHQHSAKHYLLCSTKERNSHTVLKQHENFVYVCIYLFPIIPVGDNKLNHNMDEW